MLRNHKLARAISDASWSEFFRDFEYKADWRGATILKLDTFLLPVEPDLQHLRLPEPAREEPRSMRMDMSRVWSVP